jgi:uncharacterized membrane protein
MGDSTPVLAAGAIPAWFPVVHLLAAIVYVGGILSAARLLGILAGADKEMRIAAAAFGRRVYLSLTLPAGLILVGTGIWLLATDPGGQAYLKHGWFHMKLTLVLLLVIVDHLLVLRPLRGLARGTLDPSGQAPLLRAAFPVIALLAMGVLLAIFVFHP